MATNGDTYHWLAAAFGFGVGTVYRHLRAAVGLLSVHARNLAKRSAVQRCG
ncbi:hypothetical protein GCM10009682_23810 [Luedemannella flava]|uniref:Uncharacterized protein n=1 Tax=Luedemannella flava TaxID=349316 RepID=A0ABN2LWN0_9ACTN